MSSSGSALRSFAPCRHARRRLPVRCSRMGESPPDHLCYLASAMQTSLARRQRHRRAKTGSRRSAAARAGQWRPSCRCSCSACSFTTGLVGVGAAVGRLRDLLREPDRPPGRSPGPQLQSARRCCMTVRARFSLLLWIRESPGPEVRRDPEHNPRYHYQHRGQDFWSNTGFDPAAILAAFRDAWRQPRGASTITQQLADRLQYPAATTSTSIARSRKSSSRCA